MYHHFWNNLYHNIIISAPFFLPDIIFICLFSSQFPCIFDLQSYCSMTFMNSEINNFTVICGLQPKSLPQIPKVVLDYLYFLLKAMRFRCRICAWVSPVTWGSTPYQSALTWHCRFATHSTCEVTALTNWQLQKWKQGKSRLLFHSFGSVRYEWSETYIGGIKSSQLCWYHWKQHAA